VAGRPPLEVADVFRCPEVQALVGRYPAHHRRIVRALTACRTAALGGHVDECDRCGHRQISYNSCRNRHCPKCQGSATADWVDAQEEHLLPVPYCHVVFTLPQELSCLAVQNARVLYRLLFKSASEALLEVAADPRHLGARIGFLTILHTWGQKLELHPHLHCLVPAGGIALNQKHWISCRNGFFLPVRVLSRVFRGKYLAELRQAHAQGRLQMPEDLTKPGRFAQLLRQLYDHEWVVYARPPFGGSAQVLRYLARYTHRVAISNQRLRSLERGRVSFEWKDYTHGHRPRILTLAVAEFARRFLLHVLPERFVRIRYYGFLANACRERDLHTCRLLLEQHPLHDQACEAPNPDFNDASPREEAQHRCPACQKGKLRCIEIVPPDTS
jgi:hypothetical protein